MSDATTFRAVQEHFGFQTPAPVEKDWHVIRAMRAITATDAAPFRLVFAGGTCLARGHRLISRMSEDVDFKVEPLGEDPASANQRRKQLGRLRDQITDSLRSAGFLFEKSDITSRDDNRYTAIQLPYADRDQLQGLLRPTILVELTYASLRRPAVTLPVASFVAEASGQPAEIAAIPCVDTTETAAEKLVSLTRRTAMELAGVSRAPDPTLVRHIYDLHQLRAHIDRAATIELARSIAVADAAEFRNQYPAYAEDIAGETRKAIAFLQSDVGMRERYANFLALMVYGEHAEFGQAMDLVAALAASAWP